MEKSSMIFTCFMILIFEIPFFMGALYIVKKKMGKLEEKINEIVDKYQSLLVKFEKLSQEATMINKDYKINKWKKYK